MLRSIMIGQEELFAKGVPAIPHGASEKTYQDIEAGRCQSNGSAVSEERGLDVPDVSAEQEAADAFEVGSDEQDPDESMEDFLARALENLSPIDSEEDDNPAPASFVPQHDVDAVSRPPSSKPLLDLVQQVLHSTKYGVFSIVPKQANSRLRYGGFQARCVFHRPACENKVHRPSMQWSSPPPSAKAHFKTTCFANGSFSVQRSSFANGSFSAFQFRGVMGNFRGGQPALSAKNSCT